MISALEDFDAELNAMDGDSFEEEIFKEPEDHEHQVEKIAEYEFEDGPVRESEAAILLVPAAVVPPESGRARQTRQKVVFAPHSGCSAGCDCPIVNSLSSSKAGRKNPGIFCTSSFPVISTASSSGSTTSSTSTSPRVWIPYLVGARSVHRWVVPRC